MLQAPLKASPKMYHQTHTHRQLTELFSFGKPRQKRERGVRQCRGSEGGGEDLECACDIITVGRKMDLLEERVWKVYDVLRIS